MSKPPDLTTLSDDDLFDVELAAQRADRNAVPPRITSAVDSERLRGLVAAAERNPLPPPSSDAPDIEKQRHALIALLRKRVDDRAAKQETLS